MEWKIEPVGIFVEWLDTPWQTFTARCPVKPSTTRLGPDADAKEREFDSSTHKHYFTTHLLTASSFSE